MARDSLRKSTQPTVAIIDSQSVRTRPAQSVKGVDGGKKIKGIKRHLVVDSNGFPLTIVISRANVHDSKGATGLAIDRTCKYPNIRLLKAGKGYRGPLVKNQKEGLHVELECVKSNFGTSEFITDIFIFSCPKQKLPSPRPIVMHLRPLVSVTMQPHCSLTARTHLLDA